MPLLGRGLGAVGFEVEVHGVDTSCFLLFDVMDLEMAKVGIQDGTTKCLTEEALKKGAPRRNCKMG